MKIALKKESRRPASPAFIVVAVTILIILSISYGLQIEEKYLISSFIEAGSTRQLKEWRETTQKTCQAILDSSEQVQDKVLKKEKLEKNAIQEGFILPQVTADNNNLRGVLEHKKYESCKNAFIDLGTNIGDSIGYFVDLSIDVCYPLWMKSLPQTRKSKDFPHPHLDINKLEISHKGSEYNRLHTTLLHHMTNTKDMTPENTCVYGMEGNPIFTERLNKLENYIMDMKPRPVRHLHIHTESVATAEDGPTKLFLDKSSVKNNFWGSSILSSHQDAVKSANELNGGTVFEAPVVGIRLTTLIKNTMLPFKAEATEQEKEAGTLIVKMDVEGAEYMIIKDVAQSNVLCDYIKLGNRVVMIVEMHNRSISDVKERQALRAGFGPAKRQLEECGVQFATLSAYDPHLQQAV